MEGITISKKLKVKSEASKYLELGKRELEALPNNRHELQETRQRGNIIKRLGNINTNQLLYMPTQLL